MSLQASHLGYGKKALDLADSAAEAAPASGPRLVAFLRGQQAAAAAMTGDRATALTRLRETETALSQADNRRDAVGGYDQAAYFFHEAHVRWHLKDPGHHQGPAPLERGEGSPGAPRTAALPRSDRRAAVPHAARRGRLPPGPRSLTST